MTVMISEACPPGRYEVTGRVPVEPARYERSRCHLECAGA